MSPKSTGDLADRQPTYKFPEKEGSRLLGELILYIAKRCEADPTFGAVKLNKLLWWSDFLFYARKGQPITGVEYQKLPAGPAPVQLVPVRNALIEAGDAEIVTQRYHAGVQMRLVPLREARTDEFSEQQLSVVDELIDEMWGQSAAQVSRESHGKAWEGRKVKELIPYEAIFLSDDPATESDVRRTHELAEEHGWERA